jgi:TRAP-type C4-dicarboxylate transport system substrate-binding protein
VSEGNKTAITTCADEAQARGTQASKDYTQLTMDGLAAGGMTVGPAGDQLMGELRGIGETMTAEWLEAAGEDGKAIVDGYKAMK